MSAISELETQLRADPCAWEGWLVYADFLVDRGDARGELTLLEHRLEQAGSLEEQRALQGEIETLHTNGIGDEGARALAASTAFPSLQLLDLTGNRMGEEGKAALMRSAALRGCRVLT